MHKPFTGWFTTPNMLGFFGIVPSVNIPMRPVAHPTLGGTVVDNSYVASQEFNGWLAAAHKQQRLGWNTRLSLVTGRHVRIEATKAGAALTGLSGAGLASHPLGATPPIKLDFSQAPDGSLTSAQALPQGRWLIHVSLRRGTDSAKLATDLQ